MNELGVVGFGHVGTYIKNMEVSKRFYMGILGFEILYECYHEHSGNRLCFLKNKDCVVEAGGSRIEEGGTVTLCKVAMEKTAPIIMH